MSRELPNRAERRALLRMAYGRVIEEIAKKTLLRLISEEGCSRPASGGTRIHLKVLFAELSVCSEPVIDS